MSNANAEPFSWAFPLYTLAEEGILYRFGMPAAVHLPATPDYGVVVHLFTDEDLSDRYVVAAPDRGLARVELATKIELVQLLDHATAHGAAHVLFDSPGTPGHRQHPAQTAPIGVALQVGRGL